MLTCSCHPNASPSHPINRGRDGESPSGDCLEIRGLELHAGWLALSRYTILEPLGMPAGRPMWVSPLLRMVRMGAGERPRVVEEMRQALVDGNYIHCASESETKGLE